MRLEGKVAIVTGGSRGIGRAIADRFSKEGALVTLIDRDKPSDALHEGQHFTQGDVSSPLLWEQVTGEILAKCRRIDVLVNNAGIIDHAKVHEIDLAQWERTIAVNQTAVMLGMRAVIPTMLPNHAGAIVNISSIWGSVAAAGAASYHATKAAVRNLTKNAAVTYANQGVRVNSIHPGLIRTPIVDLQEEEKTAWVIARTPMGHMGIPADIANGALFLASDEAAFVTGTELYIDGGYTAQ
ncbi:glucose 1-dehydrogenase [Paraburkholderia agricolaris]|uniref:Glucose 1-dehydrogenase n=1 Tax=Paraburkholderia agricolaris TaxID=2152888 RepID=A0ABW9A140_9BURK